MIMDDSAIRVLNVTIIRGKNIPSTVRAPNRNLRPLSLFSSLYLPLSMVANGASSCIFFLRSLQDETRATSGGDSVCYLEVQGSKKKTSIQRASMNPHWNQSFEFYNIEDHSTVDITIQDKEQYTHAYYNVVGFVEIPVTNVGRLPRCPSWFSIKEKSRHASKNKLFLNSTAQKRSPGKVLLQIEVSLFCLCHAVHFFPCRGGGEGSI
jgi:hypothetical protein